MSFSHIPEKVKVRSWGKAAGRCQYRGCNEPLWLDDLTQFEFNWAYIAHIIADKPAGPRGDAILSEKLKDNPSNLMILCDKHHRLVDKEDVEGHPVKVLQKMKAEHEERIDIQTGIKPERASELILFNANIGPNYPVITYKQASVAVMSEGKYPAAKESDTIKLGVEGSILKDDEDAFWASQPENLAGQINQRIRPRLNNGTIEHMSIFAFGPQPLLLDLGRQLSDVTAADVYQLHRTPPDWLWQDSPSEFKYIINKPDDFRGEPVLFLSLSASIPRSRAKKVPGNSSIWEITIPEPSTDFLKAKCQLDEFSRIWPMLLDEIKHAHGEQSHVHLFPAAPLSICVEAGRRWQPKAHLPIIIYDQLAPKQGSVPRITLRNENTIS